MCTVSMIGDEFGDRWKTQPFVYPPPSTATWTVNLDQISRKEFEELKKEVELMKKLLIRAKIYDTENGEPDCEMDDTVALLKAVAKAFEVDLADVFEK